VKKGKLLAAITLAEDDDDLRVYRRSKSARDIFCKRKDEGYYSCLIIRHLMGSETKCRGYLGVSKGFFKSIHYVIQFLFIALGTYTRKNPYQQYKNTKTNTSSVRLALQDFRVSRRSQGSDAAAAWRRGTCPCDTHARDVSNYSVNFNMPLHARATIIPCWLATTYVRQN
jgi:hypothetical protein